MGISTILILVFSAILLGATVYSLCFSNDGVPKWMRLRTVALGTAWIAAILVFQFVKSEGAVLLIVVFGAATWWSLWQQLGTGMRLHGGPAVLAAVQEKVRRIHAGLEPRPKLTIIDKILRPIVGVMFNVHPRQR